MLAHPSDEHLPVAALIVPQLDVATFRSQCECGGMSGMPLQAGDLPAEGMVCCAITVQSERADKRLLEALEVKKQNKTI